MPPLHGTEASAVSLINPAGDGAPARAAMRDAERAARQAGVTIRDVAELTDIDVVCRLFDTIWRPDPHHRPVTADVLRALAKGGNYVGGAFADDRLVGACAGFFAPPRELSLHSHITGVADEAHGRHVGYALKLHQRAWAVQHGLTSITWTFDPLVCRNAYFNLAKLAAEPVEYLPNFYGDMKDGINGGDDTDRLYVRWHLHADAVAVACSGSPARHSTGTYLRQGARIGLGTAPDGGPQAGDLGADTVLVAVPPDIERLRIEAPDRARLWRRAVREVFATLMGEGAHVTGFDRAGHYVFGRKTPKGTAPCI